MVKMRQLLESLVSKQISHHRRAGPRALRSCPNDPDLIALAKQGAPGTQDLYFRLAQSKSKNIGGWWGQDDRAGALDVGLFMLRRLLRRAHAHLSALRPLGPCRAPR